MPVSSSAMCHVKAPSRRCIAAGSPRVKGGGTGAGPWNAGPGLARTNGARRDAWLRETSPALEQCSVFAPVGPVPPIFREIVFIAAADMVRVWAR